MKMRLDPLVGTRLAAFPHPRAETRLYQVCSHPHLDFREGSAQDEEQHYHITGLHVAALLATWRTHASGHVS